MKLLKTALILLVIVLIFGLVAFGLNFVTAPYIGEHSPSHHTEMAGDLT